MHTDPSPAPQLIQQAYAAVKRGDRHAARLLAEKAAALAPELEDPWLLMAAVASPRASIGYIEQALKINPNSQAAHQAMAWARKRVARESASQPAQPAPPPAAAASSANAPAPPRTQSFPDAAYIR